MINLTELNSDFIDNLTGVDECTRLKYIRHISSEIREEAKTVGIQKARENANKKYGKFWRDRLNEELTYDKDGIVISMIYHSL